MRTLIINLKLSVTIHASARLQFKNTTRTYSSSLVAHLVNIPSDLTTVVCIRHHHELHPQRVQPSRKFPQHSVVARPLRSGTTTWPPPRTWEAPSSFLA
ncbi:hypothetical protein PsorP6_016032 [Peronosclerospora sorghi]|uniref:Uncharacterized protein n=1 Tax=Peronosclerospora sorghi TaxID=230839 RepID=A0ACC0WPD4_9STRA|nr:hypothetical protein PsorP6_016032 [Peronosclerospora sorghi]